MKTESSRLITALVLLALAFSTIEIPTAQAQGTTAFTYQGRLNTGTNAANGSYDMTFAVYDAAVSGNLIAGPVTNSAVAVSNGLFTVTLNFGAGVFTGTNYWVQMAVSPAGVGAFATLSPNQQLTPSPYALSLIAPQSYALCPPGSVMAYMGTNAPAGWLLCDGSVVSQTQYPALFAVIGTASGTGTNSTTFNLPDMRGVFLRGVNGARNDAFADPGDGRISIAGGNTGNAVGSYQEDMLVAHSHTVSREIGYAQGEGGYHASEWTADTGRQDTFNTSVTGGSETRAKNVYVNYIIKY